MKTTNPLKPSWRALFTGLIGVLALAHNSPAAMPTAPVTTPAQTSASAAGNSYAPVFSLDGRYLVFVSQANNLVTNDDLGLGLDVFVRDLANQTTTLVSVNTNNIGGGNLDANYPSISSNGQWVAFASAASDLVPNDTNELSDVFVRDLVTGTTRLVSLDYTGTTSASGKSSAPLISADGRWVFFESTATNLVPGRYSTNLAQIYARDLQSNVTYLVSITADGQVPRQGQAETPAISPDGRYVVFASTSTNLEAGMTSQRSEACLRDIAGGRTLWISSGAELYFTNNYSCFKPVLSANAMFCAYKASSGGTNPVLVLWFDVLNGVTVCVSSNSVDTSWPELSADGRFLAYEDGTNVYVWDSQAQTNLLINIGYDGLNPGNGPAKTPVLSADGKTVAFMSAATDLLTSNAPSTTAVFQLYARSLESNVTWLVSANPAGGPSADSLEFLMPAVSPDGRKVAFESSDENLVPGDLNRASDAFVRHLETSMTELISVRHDARPTRTGTGNCIVGLRNISRDGRYAVITSTDNTLGTGDTNLVNDIYLLDLAAGTNLWIYVPTNSICTNAQPIIFPTMSENGQTLAFLRNSSEGTTPHPKEGYVFERDLRVMNLFNLNPTGGVAATALDTSSSTYRMFGMSLSPDGQRLAFTGAGTELTFGTGSWCLNIYIHDVASHSNSLVTRSVAPASPGGGNGDSTIPQFSPDGRWISFISRAGNLVTNGTTGTKLWAWDSQTDTLRMIFPYSSNFVFSPDSHYVTFDTYYSGVLGNVYVHDLYAEPSTNVLVVTNMRNPSASHDAEVIAFQSMPTNSITHIFAKHMPSATMELITVAPDGLTPGNGASSPPQITPNGRFVLFSSKASNLVYGDTNNCSDIFLRDRQLGLTYLLSANPKTGRSGNRPSTSPLMSSDGSTVIFASLANDLAEADYNDKQDIFVVKLAGSDSDSDGLDDTWEMAYFGSLDRDGSGDADGDGLKDREELRAGTDPTNQGSVLRALLLAPVGGTQTTLMWPAGKGAQYKVQFKRNVNDAAWTDLSATITLNGNVASAVDTEAGLDAARFYRILLLP